MDYINVQQLKRGTLEMIVLSLIYKHDCSYGYAILNKLDQMGEECFRNPKAGTIYPVLYRLEAQNLIRVVNEQGADSQRRKYEVTDEGKETLKKMMESWQHYISVVNKFI